MLSDEEKKAIGQCKLLLNGDITLHIIDDDGGTAYCGIVNKEYNKDLETVLNLIEKQSKEIEELNLENIELKQSKIVDKNSIPNKDNFYDCYNFIHKDKIKAKIEEAKKSYNDLHTKHLRDCGIAEQRELAKIEVLQSLVEKE